MAGTDADAFPLESEPPALFIIAEEGWPMLLNDPAPPPQPAAVVIKPAAHIATAANAAMPVHRPRIPVNLLGFTRILLALLPALAVRRPHIILPVTRVEYLFLQRNSKLPAHCFYNMFGKGSHLLCRGAAMVNEEVCMPRRYCCIAKPIAL